jgi:putative ABC transport system permease protein
VGINVLTGISSTLDQKSEAQNGADFCFFTSSAYGDDIVSILNASNGFQKMEQEDSVWYDNIDYRNITQNSEWDNYGFFYLDYSKERSISNLEVAYEGDKFEENSIVLPSYMKVAYGFQTGDIIEMKIDNKTYQFEVYGFSEDVMFANPMCTNYFKLFISPTKFGEIKENVSGGYLSKNYNVILEDGYPTEDYEAEIMDEIKSVVLDYQTAKNYSMNYDILSYGASITISISMTIITVFAILIVILAMFIIRISIITMMEENLPNVGMLEAEGYTGKQLIRATLIEYFLIAFFGIFTGFLISGMASGVIGIMISSSLGLFWVNQMNMIAGIISVVIILLMLFMIILGTAKRYLKLTPLTALRGGIQNFHFRKNRLPFVKSRLNLHATISLKNILNDRKRNISIVLIIALLTFTSAVCFNMYYNFAQNLNKLIQMMGMETSEIIINVMGTPSGELNIYGLTDELEKQDGVEKVLREYAGTLMVVKNEQSMPVNISGFHDYSVLEANALVEGRYPEEDNEIMLSPKVSNSINATVGDVIYLNESGNRQSYMVVGIVQSTNNLGRVVETTEEGIVRLNSEMLPSNLYVYLEDDADTDTMIATISEKYQDYNIVVMNYTETLEGMMSTITNATGGLSYIFMILTMLVIVLIVCLLIKMKLSKEMRMLGIYKAIGYTTWQLILQIILSYVPVVSIGSILGIGVAIIGMNPFFRMVMSAMGIIKCNLQIYAISLVGTFAMIVIVAVITSILTSLRIRKIVPCRMIRE